MKKHRYTGVWPPIKILQKIYNWDYALGEESSPGQDETTIKPQEVQNCIDNWTAFTVATVEFNDQSKHTAIIELINSKISSISVFHNDKDNECWRIVKNWNNSNWEPFIQDWLPVERRCDSVTMKEYGIFPLKILSKLPNDKGKHIEFILERNA